MRSVEPRLIRRLFWGTCGLIWFGGTAAGLAWMANYANRPGIAAHAPSVWPAGSRLTRDPSRPTLVMFAHPQCDCTRASLAELAELIARAKHRPKTYVVFIHPTGVTDWEHTPLWSAAASLPDASVIRDDDGAEARRFGSETSGQTMLFAGSGNLMFSGGTTSSRGHLGDNVGVTIMVALLGGGKSAQTTTPVFGCSLFGPADSRSSQEAARP